VKRKNKIASSPFIKEGEDIKKISLFISVVDPSRVK